MLRFVLIAFFWTFYVFCSSLRIAHNASTSRNKTKLLPIETELLSYQQRTWPFFIHACFQATYCFYSLTTAHAPSIAFRYLPSNSAGRNWLRHWRGTPYLRGAVHRHGQRVAKGLVLKDCGRNIASRHARIHEARPSRIKKRVPSRFKRLWFDLCWRKQGGTEVISWVVCY